MKDAAIVLGAIAGHDPHDPLTDRIPFAEIPDYAEVCSSPVDVSGMRLGIPRNTFNGIAATIVDSFDSITQELQRQGAELVEVEFSGVSEYHSLTFEQRLWALATEFRVSINAFLGGLVKNPHGINNLEDLCEFTRKEPQEDYPNRDQGLWELALRTDPDGEEYKKAKERETRFAGDAGILGAIQNHALDAIITPTSTKISNHFAAGGGLPMVTVPLGFLPEGTQVKWNDRHDLIQQAPNRP